MIRFIDLLEVYGKQMYMIYVAVTRTEHFFSDFIFSFLKDFITFANVFSTKESKLCGSSSVGRASASQAEGRGFESRFPLF
jgi:hypothetical protein